MIIVHRCNAMHDLLLPVRNTVHARVITKLVVIDGSQLRSWGRAAAVCGRFNRRIELFAPFTVRAPIKKFNCPLFGSS